MRLILAALAAAAVAATACAPSGTRPAGAPPAISVFETPAELGAIASSLKLTGTVSPRWTVVVLPKGAGAVVSLPVEAGQSVEAGEVLAVLDHRVLDDQVAQARANVRAVQAKLDSFLAGARTEDVAASQAGLAAAEAIVAQARAGLDAAQLRLAVAQSGGRPEVVAQAQAKLDADRAALDKLFNGPTALDLRSAELALAAARDRLWLDQTSLDFQQSRGLVSDEQRRAALVADQLAIDQAKAALDRLKAPPRAEDVAALQAAITADEQTLALAQAPLRSEEIGQLEQAVAVSQAQLEQAQQQAAAQRALAEKAGNPFTVYDIGQARAAVEVAQAALQVAETARADATIVAPAPGVVTEVPVAVGSLVGPQTPVATLISTELEVSVAVEESQVPLVNVGQPVQIGAAAIPDVPGEVFLVAPAADPRTRKFTVKARPLTASAFRAGMSAVVAIEVDRRENAVLVPKDAVLQRSGREIVFVDADGRARMRTVQTGRGDGARLPILSGVRAGEMVILPGSLSLSDGDAITAVGR